MTHAPQIGDKISDRYTLEALVGSGGMSTVFRAYDAELERRVALKILHEHFAGDDEYVGRFAIAAVDLVERGYLLADDVADLLKHAVEHYDWALVGGKGKGTP